jgi:glycosyltransferase involved in cell wall biosynthesis
VLADDLAFAGELAALLGDAPRRERMAAEGLRRARAYSLSRMVGEYEELLYELTEVHAGSAARV